MQEYVVEFFKKAYVLIDETYARDRRMSVLKELEQSGKLERMCTSEIHEILGIRKVSNEF